MKVFAIYYDYDNGSDHVLDMACVPAESSEVAIEKLKQFIRQQGHEFQVARVFRSIEMQDKIHTKRFL